MFSVPVPSAAFRQHVLCLCDISRKNLSLKRQRVNPLINGHIGVLPSMFLVKIAADGTGRAFFPHPGGKVCWEFLCRVAINVAYQG